MAADASDRTTEPTDADRVCVNCGKTVNPDRERLCNHCGLPFRTAVLAGSQPAAGSAVPPLLKVLATFAFVLPPLGPLPALFAGQDVGSLLGVAIVAIAGVVAIVFAWRRPLPGGILVALAGNVPAAVGAAVGAAGTVDPVRLYWLYWFMPGGLVGGALFLAAGFLRAPAPEPGRERAGAGSLSHASLARRARREAGGVAALVVVGLVLLAISVASPDQPEGTLAGPGLVYLAWPLVLVGAGVLGYHEDGASGAFVAGLVGAVLAMAGILAAAAATGHEAISVGPGEWIGEAWLAVGLAIVAGGFLGLVGGGIAALLGGRLRPSAHP